MNIVYIVNSVNGTKGFEDFLGAYDYARFEKIAPMPMIVSESGELISRSELI